MEENEELEDYETRVNKTAVMLLVLYIWISVLTVTFTHFVFIGCNKYIQNPTEKVKDDRIKIK